MERVCKNFFNDVKVVQLGCIFLLIFTFVFCEFAIAAKKSNTVEPYDSPIHYRPKVGWVADVIPFFWKDQYHIFYLLAGPTQKGVSWAHIVSEDLIHWKELPVALSSGKPDEPDGYAVFTGSVIEHEGVFHAFYTGWNPEHPKTGREHPKGREQIMHATSKDLITWMKHPEDTFHADGVHYQFIDKDGNKGHEFRDPYVFWNENEKVYWMIFLARDAKSGIPTTGKALSEDLKNWRQVSPLEHPTLPFFGRQGQPECPDLFQIDNTYYLLFSSTLGAVMSRYSSNICGPYTDPQKPVIDNPVRFPTIRVVAGLVQPYHGCNNIDTHALYAAKRLFDGKRHVLIGWIGDMSYQKDHGGYVWGGTMCLPREVYAGPNGNLYCRPVPEAKAVFSHKVFDLSEKQESFEVKWDYEDSVLVGKSSSFDSQYSFDVPANYMMECLVQMDSDSVFRIGMREQPQLDSGYHLILRPSQKEIEIGGPGLNCPRKCDFDVSKPIKIQAFVQGSIIECFVNDAFAFTCRAYDFKEGKLGLSVAGGKVKVLDLTVMTAEQ